jgi:hypothetical protein
MRIPVANRDTNLRVQRLFHWRSIDAPEMANRISLKRLKNKTRCKAVSDAGFDDISRPKMTGQTPNRSGQSSIAIIPVFEALRTDPNPLGLQFSYHFRPQGPELRIRLARPRDAKQIMQPVLPTVLGFV